MEHINYMSLQSFKKQFRNSLVTLFSMIGLAYIYRTFFVRSPFVRVVVFHDVQNGVWFESMIQTLVTHFHVITPEAFMNDSFHSQKINVLITFDDGYASWKEVVAPVLHAYGIKAIFFINSGLIEVANDVPKHTQFMENQLRISPRPPLNAEGVSMLAREGHTIGGHTQKHFDLTTLNSEILREEISGDKEELQQRLGETLTEFAYPFGTRAHVNKTIVRATEQAGYLRGYTAISRFYVPRHQFYIPRMCIEDNLTPLMLKRWVKGAYDLFDILKTLCVR